MTTEAASSPAAAEAAAPIEEQWKKEMAERYAHMSALEAAGRATSDMANALRVWIAMVEGKRKMLQATRPGGGGLNYNLDLVYALENHRVPASITTAVEGALKENIWDLIDKAIEAQRIRVIEARKKVDDLWHEARRVNTEIIGY